MCNAFAILREERDMTISRRHFVCISVGFLYLALSGCKPLNILIFLNVVSGGERVYDSGRNGGFHVVSW